MFSLILLVLRLLALRAQYDRKQILHLSCTRTRRLLLLLILDLPVPVASTMTAKAFPQIGHLCELAIASEAGLRQQRRGYKR